MRLFFVFLSFLIICTPTAFAEVISLKCTYKDSFFSPYTHDTITSKKFTTYLTIDLDAKTITYPDGTPHRGYKSVRTDGGVIRLEGDMIGDYSINHYATSINRYTGEYFSLNTNKPGKLSQGFTETLTITGEGFCQPYTPKQLF